MNSKPHDYARLIKESAFRHGFMGAGIARAEHMDEEAARLELWLKKDYHGEMAYMANHFDMRVDPTKLVPGAKSVISLLYNYYPRAEAKEMPDARHADARREKEMPERSEANTSAPLSIGIPPNENHLRRDTRSADARREKEMLDARLADARRETRNFVDPDQHDDQILTTHNSYFDSAQHKQYSQLTTDNSQLTIDTSTPLSTNNTHNSQLTTDNSRFKISRYAYGEDYHKVVRRKLKELVTELKNEIGDFNARVFVDSAPVMERDWAKRSGQGWIGKNTLLIHPKKGSYFFLAEIILDVELEYDHPMRDHCGTCTKCIDACPTEAISPEGYILDGSKCISYLTIELKNQIPNEFKGMMDNWIYGCDICQEVCPWNRFSTPHQEPAFDMKGELQQMTNRDWIELTEDTFERVFDKSAVKRTKYAGLVRNVKFLSPDKQAR